MLAIGPLLILGAALVLVIVLAGAMVLLVASLFRPELRRTLAKTWHVLRALRTYRRWQQEPKVTVVDVEEVDKR
jgi:hypothetical protein